MSVPNIASGGLVVLDCCQNGNLQIAPVLSVMRRICLLDHLLIAVIMEG